VQIRIETKLEDQMNQVNEQMKEYREQMNRIEALLMGKNLNSEVKNSEQPKLD